MTGLVNILLESMTTDERSYLMRAAKGCGLSQQEQEMLEQLRLVEVDAATGLTKLSAVGLEVSSRL